MYYDSDTGMDSFTADTSHNATWHSVPLLRSFLEK